MRWFIPLIAAMLILILGCASNDDSDTTIEPAATEASEPTAEPETTIESAGTAVTEATTPATGDAPDTTGAPSEDEAFGTLEGLQELLAGVTGFDPEMIQDVGLQENTLTITLNQDETFAESNDVDSMCDELSEVIGFAGLEIVIESSTGGELAQCSLST